MPEAHPYFDKLPLWEIYRPQLGGYFQNLEGKSFLELNGAGDKEPAVHGHAKRDIDGQLWHCLEYGQKNTVLICNKATKRIIVARDSDNTNKHVTCEIATKEVVLDEASQWRIEWKPIQYGKPHAIRFKNVKTGYALDLAGGSKDDGAPVCAWPIHGHAWHHDGYGNKDQNQLWQHIPEGAKR